MKNPKVVCTNCGLAYPDIGVPFRCPTCGGLYDYDGIFHFNPAKVDQSRPGIWQYRQTFGLPPDLEPVSLGEGNTPLILANVFNRSIYFKCEYLNPSGSFKDRGSAVIITWLHSRGLTEAVEDSSGNAGASLAAYAAYAGIKARIFVPVSSSGPKRRQIEAYGAELIPVTGSRADVTDAAMKEAQNGAAYASHAYLPFNLPGYATAAYEIFEQLGQMPGAVIVPAGQGGFLLGLIRGFEALRIVNELPALPRMIGVQTRSCAPLWDKFMAKDKESGPIKENFTLAEGVRVCNPLRMDSVLMEVVASLGCISVTDENEILPGRAALARLGFYVEPTSAIVWAAMARMLGKLPDPVVVILTGSGMKYG
jgi:threonine synthase